MRICLLFALVCSISGFWGCSKDNTVNSPTLPPVEAAGITFSGALAQSSGLNLIWEATSAIGLYCEQAVENEKAGVANYKADVKEGAGTASAQFAATLTQGEGKHLFYAYAPYSGTAGDSAAALKGKIAAAQTQGADPMQNVLNNSLFWASASFDAGSEAKNAIFQFRNLYGVIEFTIGSDGSFGDNAVTSVSLDAGEGGVLAGAVAVDLTAEQPAATVTGEQSSTVELTLTAENVFVGDGKVKAWMVVTPADYTGRKFAVVVKIGENELPFEIDGMKVEANGVVKVDLNCVDPNLIDLNKDGIYSNSYIVTEPNTTYKFDAKVQGNGKATAGIPAPVALNPKNVFVVWESGNEFDGVISGIELSADGIVSFTTAGAVNGNALIAVTDGVGTPDAPRGSIIWSWHIWATDYTEALDKRCVNFEGKEFMLMDRNLGDWIQPEGTDEKFRGLKYQWGRKDPFFGLNSSGTVPDGACVQTDSEYYGFGSASVFDAQPSPSTADGTINLAVMYPFYFFKGGWGTDSDWYGIEPGVAGRNNNLWGNADGNPVKTIYDPCPKGYMVAPIEAFTGFSKIGFSKITIPKADLNTSGEWNEGWNFITEGTNFSFFQAAGSMTFSSGSLSIVSGPGGAAGYYWTTTPPDASSQMRSINIDRDILRQNTVNRAAGESVRCVREL